MNSRSATMPERDGKQNVTDKYNSVTTKIRNRTQYNKKMTRSGRVLTYVDWV